MWTILGFFVLIYLVLQKYYNKKNVNSREKVVPAIPFLSGMYSILTGPRVEILDNIPDEYYESGVYKARLGPNDYYYISNADFTKILLTEPGSFLYELKYDVNLFIIIVNILEEMVPKYGFEEELPVFKFYRKGIIFSNGDVSDVLYYNYNCFK